MNEKPTDAQLLAVYDTAETLEEARELYAYDQMWEAAKREPLTAELCERIQPFVLAKLDDYCRDFKAERGKTLNELLISFLQDVGY